jgi:hypothetical protein
VHALEPFLRGVQSQVPRQFALLSESRVTVHAHVHA